jgi:hypothetical protein
MIKKSFLIELSDFFSAIRAKSISVFAPLRVFFFTARGIHQRIYFFTTIRAKANSDIGSTMVEVFATNIFRHGHHLS